MAKRNVYLFNCPGKKHNDHIVLPTQSHLGKFDGLSDPSKDIWPIRYLCLYCGQASVIDDNMIRREAADTQDRYQLVRYDFASGQSGTLQHFAIYTKEPISDLNMRHVGIETPRAIFERVLKPFGLVDDSFGDNANVSVDRGACAPLPIRIERPTQ